MDIKSDCKYHIKDMRIKNKKNASTVSIKLSVKCTHFKSIIYGMIQMCVSKMHQLQLKYTYPKEDFPLIFIQAVRIISFLYILFRISSPKAYVTRNMIRYRSVATFSGIDKHPAWKRGQRFHLTVLRCRYPAKSYNSRTSKDRGTLVCMQTMQTCMQTKDHHSLCWLFLSFTFSSIFLLKRCCELQKLLKTIFLIMFMVHKQD